MPRQPLPPALLERIKRFRPPPNIADGEPFSFMIVDLQVDPMRERRNDIWRDAYRKAADEYAEHMHDPYAEPGEEEEEEEEEPSSEEEDDHEGGGAAAHRRKSKAYRENRRKYKKLSRLKRPGEPPCSVYIWGRSDRGFSVQLVVRGYRPSFFVMLDSIDKQRDAEDILQVLEENRCQPVRRKIVVRDRSDGFHDGPAEFLELKFLNTNVRNKAAKALGQSGFAPRELEIVDVIRFCIETGLLSAGWVNVHRGWQPASAVKPTVEPVVEGMCALSVVVTLDEDGGHAGFSGDPDRSDIAPIVFLAWDCETMSHERLKLSAKGRPEASGAEIARALLATPDLVVLPGTTSRSLALISSSSVSAAGARRKRTLVQPDVQEKNKRQRIIEEGEGREQEAAAAGGMRDIRMMPRATNRDDWLIQISNTCWIAGEPESAATRHVHCFGETDAPTEDEPFTLSAHATEAELLDAWAEFVAMVDPDVLYTYNGNMFDLQYVVVRAAFHGVDSFFSAMPRAGRAEYRTKGMSTAQGFRDWFLLGLRGRVHVDLLDAVQRIHQKKYKSYKLDFVSKKLLGDQSGKLDLPPQELFKAYESGPAGRLKIARYADVDTFLLRQLTDPKRLDTVTGVIEMSRVCNVPINTVLTGGVQVRTSAILYRAMRDEGRVMMQQHVKPEGIEQLREAGLLEKAVLKEGQRAGKRKQGKEKRYEGGAVIDPKKPGLYLEPIVVLDFAALYPSIQQAFWLCYMTTITTLEDLAPLSLILVFPIKTPLQPRVFPNAPAIEDRSFDKSDPVLSAHAPVYYYRDLPDAMPERSDEIWFRWNLDEIPKEHGARAARLEQLRWDRATTPEARILLLLLELPEGQKPRDERELEEAFVLRYALSEPKPPATDPELARDNEKWVRHRFAAAWAAVLAGDVVKKKRKVEVEGGSGGVCEESIEEVVPFVVPGRDGGWTVTKAGEKKMNSLCVWPRVLCMPTEERPREHGTACECSDIWALPDLPADTLARHDAGEFRLHWWNCRENEPVLGKVLRTTVATRKAVQREAQLLDEHNPLRAVKDARQLSLKIVANSFYGGTGAEDGMFSAMDVAAATPGFGRWMLWCTKACGEAFYPIEVVYGDTDSVMFRFKPGSGAEHLEGADLVKYAFEIGERIAKVVMQIFLPPNKLEMEKVYYPYLIDKKKRYAAQIWEPPKPGKPVAPNDGIDTKGLENKRRDWCGAMVQILEGILYRVLKLRSPPKDVVDFVSSKVEAFRTGDVPLDNLIICKQLSKGEYGDDVKQEHVVVAKRRMEEDPGGAPLPGDRVEYVVCLTDEYAQALRRGKTMNSGERCFMPDEVQARDLKPDLKHYLEHKVRKPIMTLCEKLAVAEPIRKIFDGVISEIEARQNADLGIKSTNKGSIDELIRRAAAKTAKQRPPEASSTSGERGERGVEDVPTAAAAVASSEPPPPPRRKRKLLVPQPHPENPPKRHQTSAAAVATTTASVVPETWETPDERKLRLAPTTDAADVSDQEATDGGGDPEGRNNGKKRRQNTLISSYFQKLPPRPASSEATGGANSSGSNGGSTSCGKLKRKRLTPQSLGTPAQGPTQTIPQPPPARKSKTE